MEGLSLSPTKWPNFRTAPSCFGGCARVTSAQMNTTSLDYTLYHLAGQSRFGSRFMVEAIHLTDDTVETVTITAQKMSNRRATSDAMLATIAKGQFPTKIDSVTCPRCPHFFVCDAMPKGPLKLP
jgi:DNA helicase-2/ATP-dependent DNA helicase PcrA